jgi:hypothetical protein
MVAAVVISSAVFLAVDLTCRRLDTMLLQVEIALEAKIICGEEDVEKQDGRRAGKRLLIMIRRRTTSGPRADVAVLSLALERLSYRISQIN